jgi:hypothetical protein
MNSVTGISLGEPWVGQSVQVPSREAAREIKVPAGKVGEATESPQRFDEARSERQHSFSRGAAIQSCGGMKSASSPRVQEVSISKPWDDANKGGRLEPFFWIC